MTDGVPARGSLRSRGAVTVTRYTLRPISGLIPPERGGPRVDRVDPVLPDGRRVKGEGVYGPRTPTSQAARSSIDAGAIYFVHGSGYAVCSPKTHRRLTSWLSSLTGLPVFSIDYRLAPRYRFPAAADDVRAGWDWLVEICGLQTKQIVVAGDSAGGHLIVDMLLQREVAANAPAAAALFSPLFDITFGLCLARERIRPDPAIRAADAIRLVSLYHAGVDPTHHRLRL